MRNGDLFVATRTIINGLGSVPAGEIFELIEMYGIAGERDIIYRFKHRDSEMVFSTFDLEKWFEPIHQLSARELKKNKIMSEGDAKQALPLKKERNMWEGNETKGYLTGQWIVGSIHKRTGQVSFSSKPKTHGNKLDALAEAKRLATENPSKEFMAVQIGGIASAVDVVVR